MISIEFKDKRKQSFSFDENFFFPQTDKNSQDSNQTLKSTALPTHHIYQPYQSSLTNSANLQR